MSSGICRCSIQRLWALFFLRTCTIVRSMGCQDVRYFVREVSNYLTLPRGAAAPRLFRNFLYGLCLGTRLHHSAYPSVAIVNRILLFDTLTDPQA